MTTNKNNTPPYCDRVILFNNQGVQCFLAGDLRSAAVLFKGSLEVQLSLEKCAETGVPIVYEKLVQENRFIAQAEIVLDSMNQENIENQPCIRHVPTGYKNVRAKLHNNNIPLELCNLFFDPYLFSRPFFVSDPNDSFKQRSNAATTIFNMALTLQMHNRQSSQSYALYQLAISLRFGHPIQDVVVLALINNMAVWCHDHDEWDAAQQGMCVLQRIMNSPFPVQGLDESEDAALRWNIERMLTPLGSTSPAA
jgi:hypothetical protein